VEAGEAWTDPDFPPTLKSLVNDDDAKKDLDWEEYTW
jgi:hypothetical protein